MPMNPQALEFVKETPHRGYCKYLDRKQSTCTCGRDAAIALLSKESTARHDALTEAAQVATNIWDSGNHGAHGGEQANRTRQAILSLRDQQPETKGE